MKKKVRYINNTETENDALLPQFRMVLKYVCLSYIIVF
jgi:hypothetical protein